MCDVRFSRSTDAIRSLSVLVTALPDGPRWPARSRRGLRSSCISLRVSIARPESVISVRHELARLDQPPERLLDKLLAGPDVVEDQCGRSMKKPPLIRMSE